MVLFVVAVTGLAYVYASVELPEEPVLAETTFLYAADGTTVLAELRAGENRVTARLDEIAPVLRDAVIAAEDRSFFEHRGIDPRGVGRALWHDLRSGSLQGGSTITQQLVKNTYLDPDRTLQRKVREAVLAVKVEQRLSKDEVLERYLNTIYFGRAAYGIRTASRAYFGVEPADLTLSQAALLAGLIRSPGTADPALDPATADRRRRLVLDAMVATGAVTRSEADAAAAEPVVALPPPSTSTVRVPGTEHFVEFVRLRLVERFGEQVVHGGGLRVTTTLDVGLQEHARAAVTEVLDQPADPEAALVAVDESGAVVAMVGGRSFAASQVNLAIGREGGGGGRQAGSTFKPFVLAAAIDAGIPLDRLYPAPAELTVDTAAGPWHVGNADGRGHGELDLVDATVRSTNTVFARLALDVGPRHVADIARAAGVTSPLTTGGGIALGEDHVAPLEMAGAYMTFARRGEQIDPFPIARVTRADGQVLLDASPPRRRAMPAEHADAVNHVLQQVIGRGTGRAAAIGAPAAGKTGTTNGYGDAWFVGYTPRLGAAVWMGHPEGASRAMTDVHGGPVTGGTLPARIWQRFMAAAVAGRDSGAFTAPPRTLLTGTTTTTETPAAPEATSPSTTAPRTTPTTAVATSDPPTTTTPAPTTTSTPPSTEPPATPPPPDEHGEQVGTEPSEPAGAAP